MIALVTDTTNPEIVGTAFGIALFGGEVGAVLRPVMGGYIADTFGFQDTIYSLSATLFAGSILIWLAKKTLPD